jgi:uncharacterized UPF0160 family protein
LENLGFLLVVLWKKCCRIGISVLSDVSSFKVDSSGRIILMEHYAPWKEHLDELETEHAVPNDQLPFYVVYKDTSGQWRVQAGNTNQHKVDDQSVYLSWLF